MRRQRVLEREPELAEITDALSAAAVGGAACSG